METWMGIGKVIEECGEVLQLCGKAIPFPTGEHPDGKGPVRGRLEQEIGDLYAALDYFIQTNHLSINNINGIRAKKRGKFEEWGLTGVEVRG